MNDAAAEPVAEEEYLLPDQEKIAQAVPAVIP
jgi:hypothetical protein